MNFDDENYPWKAGIDYRQHPELYKVGKGEQGVLICEPYKSEIGKYWRFRNKEIAVQSSQRIFQLFEGYLANDEFVGADMARKYLQMGFTRARRYANYKGGKKYDKDNRYAPMEKGTGDPGKAQAAEVFYAVWKKAEANERYARLKTEWRDTFG